MSLFKHNPVESPSECLQRTMHVVQFFPPKKFQCFVEALTKAYESSQLVSKLETTSDKDINKIASQLIETN